jgi:hypothetical protein
MTMRINHRLLLLTSLLVLGGAAAFYACNGLRHECNDGIDNDGDGKIDWDGGPGGATPDPQCSGKPFSDREDSGCGLGAELVLLAPLFALRRRKRAAH